jgi:hypothetical protein
MPEADLALILALDCSASVTFDEFGLMASGCAAALRHEAVIAGLLGGPGGASLCAVLIWSGVGAQDVVLDWTRLDSPAAIAAFADDVENCPRSIRAGATALGDALAVCASLLDRVPPARRLVIDVVGDGRSNQGIAPDIVRDRLVELGVTINGLCVLHEEPDLLENYRDEVIGGPGAFALWCATYQEFAVAMRQKLVREIATGTPGRLA